MLPPPAFWPLLQYFDGVDAFVAARLLRKRPWAEIALTSLLCDLMDDDTAKEHDLHRSPAWLRERLAIAHPLLNVSCGVATHEYPASVERWVTQADIGMVVRYDDHVLPDRSWETAWLLQAKRVYLDPRAAGYTEASRFAATDAAQHTRIVGLNERFGYGLVKYLLYCPRADALDAEIAGKLAHFRNVAVEGHIFDFTHGLALHDELISGKSTLAAGLIVAEAHAVPGTLGEAHRSLMHGTTPWSWFLAMNLCDARRLGVDQDHFRQGSARGHEGPSLAARLVRGDTAAVAEIAVATGTDQATFPLLPAHTVEIVASIGSPLDRDREPSRDG